ncbi:MAG: SDR family oxidoreductase [Thermodesulfobacteriota bacterium]
MRQAPVLVLGATGYVGGRLVPRLLEAGVAVRAVARNPAKLACRPWAGHPLLQMAKGDVSDLASLARAAKGCRAAYYLVHSMNPQTRDYARADRQAALNMAAAAEHAGLERIIYLGGLAPDDPHLSEHLRSRAEVGRILQAGKVPATWLRAAMILGAGGASFEMMRYLVDRLPVMLTPRWVSTPCQPIAISNVLGYLQGCLDNPRTLGQTLDIGGPEVLSYRELFAIYAQEAGLPPRLIIPVPWFSPKLSSYWIHLVTPVPAALARPLTEGLRNEVVVKDGRIRDMIPQDLLSCRQAIRRALDRIAQQRVDSCWSDAGNPTPPEWVYCEDAPYAGGAVFQAGYRARLRAERERVWEGVTRLGGSTGWYSHDWLWTLRGLGDKLLGGVGLDRGRRHPVQLGVGDALDFWRVLEAEPPGRLLLLAEMKAPGQAVLEIVLDEVGPQETQLRLIARFLPRGLLGLAYWRALIPLHDRIFLGMLNGMANQLGLEFSLPARPYDPDADRACRLPAKNL